MQQEKVDNNYAYFYLSNKNKNRDVGQVHIILENSGSSSDPELK